MKLVVSTIDATPVPARKPPRDQDSWVTAAAGSWVVGLDNLSDIPAWLSDSICRAVTGDGDVRRRLYTDADLAVFAFRRCIVFNGIDLGGLRGDLADRLVPIHLRRIPDTERLDEESLWPAWTDAHPRILGALLNLAAAVTRTLPTITLDARPRMADFARIVAAVDTVLGTAGHAHYLAKQGAAPPTASPTTTSPPQSAPPSETPSPAPAPSCCTSSPRLTPTGEPPRPGPPHPAPGHHLAAPAGTRDAQGRMDRRRRQRGQQGERRPLDHQPAGERERQL